MARWLPFFAEYNFEVKYKPGRLNVEADALSRRPDYDLAHVTTVTSSVPDSIRAAYAHDDIAYPKNEPRVVVPHDENLKYRTLYEVHNTPVGGDLGREKTYGSVSTMYWWPKLYNWVGTYVRTCETINGRSPRRMRQRRWRDKAGNTCFVVFVDRLSKMDHLAVVPDTIDGEGTALLFLDQVFRQHGLPEAILSDRDAHFTAKFWKSLFQVLGIRLDMSTADHPQTDGQTERVNRVVVDILRSVCAETPRRWSEVLPLVEFALNNAVHASTGFTPFYVNGLANPRVPLTPPRRDSGLSGGGISVRLADISSIAVRTQDDDFCLFETERLAPSARRYG
ncbi:hypothetical protein C6341_g941 [Phytophthora cactorum]|nr:hypothetical protein C6341_g941 [Phytophthora cactorum]